MLLIKIIFWGIIIYYALKLFVRLFLPFILKSLAKKMISKVEQMQNQTSQDYSRKKNGEVTIEYQKAKSQKPNTKSQNSRDGEYVDFEEIKE